MSRFCKIFWARFRDRSEWHLSFATRAGSAKKSTPRCVRPTLRCVTRKAKSWKRRMCRPPISRICACANKSIQQKNAKHWSKESRGSAAATSTFISSTRTRRKGRCTRKTCYQQLRDEKLKDEKMVPERGLEPPLPC